MPIIFNGQTYNSVDDMPPDAREAYNEALGVLADKNKDGKPDVFESPAGRMPNMMGSSTTWTVNGQAMQGLEDLPPETRQQIEQAMRAMDADGNGVPDFLERMPLLAQMLPAESRQALQQMMATYRTGAPLAGQSMLGTPAMSVGAPAPSQSMPPGPMISEEGHFQMAPSVSSRPAAPQVFPKTPTLSYKPEDPDAGRRRLVLVLVALLVLLVLAGAAGVVLYALFFLVPR
jgi:hypothetical protein